MNRILIILINPFVISIPIALLIIFFLPPLFNKYKIELVKQNKCGVDQNYFHDIDHDSYSEYFCLGYEKENYTFPYLKCWTDVRINKDRVLIDQYNSKKKMAS